MILDKLDQLSLNQALTATAVGANVIDLDAANLGLPDGIALQMLVIVKVAADFGTTDETYSFAVETSAAANQSSPIVLTSRAILASALTLGSKHHFPLPQSINMLRFLGVRFTLGGTTPLLTVDAYIIPVNMAADVPRSYPTSSVIL